MPNQRDLASLFNPKSVAVIGASTDSQKLGAIVLKNIVESGYLGEVYPVNPKYQSVGNLKCFAALTEIPVIPDLAILAIPSLGVAQILKDCALKGVKNVLVFAAGYKETGPEGKKLEQELIDMAKASNINLLGPNCLGFVNNDVPINATFGKSTNTSVSLRFVSQSGAIAASLFDWCESNGMGYKEFVTLGNKAVINENDVLDYFLTTASAKPCPIGLYLESITHGPDFLRICKELSKKNPIFLLKPGKSPAAVKAMGSHTGAIAQEDDILQALVEQAGVIRCKTLREFFNLAKALSWKQLPQGPRVAVISNAGGPAVITADAVAQYHLKLADLDAQTTVKLAQTLPRSASIINPVDVLGDALADRYGEALKILLQNKDLDSVLVILTPQIMTQIEKTANLISVMSSKYNKPIFCSFMGGNLVAEGEAILNKNKVPSFRFPEEAINTMSSMWIYRAMSLRETPGSEAIPTRILSPNEIQKILNHAADSNQSALNNLEANIIIKEAGIPTPPTIHPESLTHAKEFAESRGWPVVLKLSSPKLLHKREIGGVILDIGNKDALEDAWEKLERKVEQLEPALREGLKFQIQKDVSNGVEVIVGVKQDPTFGSVLLFGAGGMFAELIGDKNLHLLPINQAEAKALVQKSKVYSILKGKGEEPAYALDKLYQLIVDMGKLAQAFPRIKEIEINPVIININDVWAVDTKVLLRADDPAKTVGPKFNLAGTLTHKILASKFHFYEFESEKPLTLKAGQYINVKVAPNTIRAYSVAANPNPHHFSLLVDTRPGGPGSQFFESLKVGDVVTYMGPFGVFTIKPNDGAKTMLFMATGSGASAIRCMIDHVLNNLHVKIPVKLYFGLTQESEIFWQEHFDELSKTYPNFSYQIALFKPEESWKGARGFITELVKKDYPKTTDCSAYLCGHKNMITDATDLLLKSGCPKERIYTERFA